MAPMDPAEFESSARRIVGLDGIQRHAPLAPLTTFRVGGAADWLADVRSVEALSALLALAREAGLPVTVLGGGSNVIVSDDGVRGLVVRPRLSGITQPQRTVVRAEAGATINGLVRWTIGRGVAGMEAWAGTPGTVGGAIYGNAHWQGRNIGDLVTHVELVTTAGERRRAAVDDMQFAYDTSRLQHTGEIVLAAEFRASQGEPDVLRTRARESLAFRKRTQPLALASAGCVFQNPDPARDRLPEGVPASAGALVDRAGLKGYRVGGAAISETHANFVVNDRGATAADVRALIDTARRAVEERFGVALRDEVVYLGTF
jgi:UDP-N-acetylmuramate dehydrogenase